jgi:hypothetical protein
VQLGEARTRGRLSRLVESATQPPGRPGANDVTAAGAGLGSCSRQFREPSLRPATGKRSGRASLERRSKRHSSRQADQR